MTPAPFVLLLLQAGALAPGDRGIYPDLDAQAEVEAAGWRIRGGRVLRRGAAGGDADRDGIPDAVDILLGAKKVALDGSVYRETAPRLPYPNGDVPRQDGVCTDVVIRALRNAGFDLQRAVYEDAGRAPWAYPRIGRRRNPSIDHRRVKNLIRYFDRHWRRLPVGATLQPGDVLFLNAIPSVPDPDHVGIASDRRNPQGLPWVIHNWSRAADMDLLPAVPLVAAFRAPSPRRGIQSGAWGAGGFPAGAPSREVWNPLRVPQIIDHADAAGAVRIEGGAAVAAGGGPGGGAGVQRRRPADRRQGLARALPLPGAARPGGGRGPG
jgi:uncharacterized protein YijF (DUF1287 family)